jgi:hypothetical protein
MKKKEKVKTAVEHMKFCPDFKDGMEHLNSMITISVVHGCGDWRAKKFVFCPYCGVPIVPGDGEDED